MVTIQSVRQEDFPEQDNLFQTAFWGRFKTACGQQAVFFLCGYERDDADSTAAARIDFPLMVLLRKTAAGLYAYAPKAPSVKIPEGEYGILLEQTALAVRQFLPEETVCIRFDTQWKSPYGNAADFPELPRNEMRELRMNYNTRTHSLRKTRRDHLCPDTVIINLKLSPEQLLRNMRQTTRNCIRRAYKENVIFSEKPKAFLPEWHKLYRSTGKRKQFYTENLEYFIQLINRPEGPGRLFFKPVASPHEDSGKGPPSDAFSHNNFFAYSQNQNGALKNNQNKTNEILSSNPSSMPVTAQVPEPSFHILAAEKNNILLSGMILATCRKTAYYMFSGSNPDYSNLMAGYGLQWEAMLLARKAGCTKYDLLGIPPNGKPSHFMNGLYTFKTGFGGEVTRYCGCWDYPYRPEQYETFANCEEFRDVNAGT
ncbi:lipid II:glycine glycyltransferase FemX [Treponema sp.]|uniref:lipid II:glycine glycyltransferase FemX n=1 Tax=Treponema sp. TaxID=166 RepID=UPI003EFE8E25